MTDTTTIAMIDGAARHIAKLIVESEMTPSERIKAFLGLIEYYKAAFETQDKPNAAPVLDAFDTLRDRINAVNGGNYDAEST
jgi:hypothetical protein